jgi:VCBS repeat protein
MLNLALTLTLAQFAAPGGGWYEPVWEAEISRYYNAEIQETVDLTGDGIAEVIVLGSVDYDSFKILDGATGSSWFELGLPGGSRADWIWKTEDLDGDGLPEFIFSNPGSFVGDGQIQVAHGGDGQIMWQAWGLEAGDRLGEFLYFADLDGDGLMDLFTGSKPNGKAVALNGLTGARLWIQYGAEQKFYSVAPDLDGDGIAELLVGGNSRLTALSGRTGATIWGVPTPQLTHAGGWKSYYSDLNQDGLLDVLIVRPKQNVGSYLRAGLIEAFNGANGHFLWSKDGGDDGAYLGKDAEFTDFTGDGVDDLLSMAPWHPMLLDGSNGAVIWERNLDAYYSPGEKLIFEDFSGDGIRDLLIHHTSAYTLQLEAMNGVDGSSLWIQDALRGNEEFSQLTLADFDSDGVMDILIITPKADVNTWNDGLARALSGATGDELWRKIGAGAESSLGFFSVVAEADATPGADVILFDAGSQSMPQRLALNGLTGLELWSVDYSPFNFSIKSWHPVELDGDGKSDVVETRRGFDEEVTILGFSGKTGQTLWSNVYQIGTSWWSQTIGAWPDISGDGVQEVMVMISGEGAATILEILPGVNGGARSGVELSSDQISVSNGGVIQTSVHFPPNQIGWNYQLLLSETGNQLTDLNGLDVPLSPGYWLSSTYIGNYPSGMITNPLGSLNSEGNAQITLDALPNRIALAYIGTTMYLAVISAEPGSPWSFSSGSAAIQILP